MFWVSSIIFIRQSKSRTFRFSRKKAWIFGLKMTIFQILIKQPEMIVSGCYKVQLKMTRISKMSPKYMLEVNNICGTYQTCQKKARRYKNEQIVFYSFGFVPLVRQLKFVSLLKLFHQICQDKSFPLRVSALSYLKKLSELDQFNIVPFFSQHGNFQQNGFRSVPEVSVS